LTVPATDDNSIWLPRELDAGTVAIGIERYRALALQQATRAMRGSANALQQASDPLVAALYLVLEAGASDAILAHLLPGMALSIHSLRAGELAQRPALSLFPRARRPLEELLRSILASDCHALPHDLPSLPAP